MTRYTTEQLASFPWIVSTDTLRSQDLLCSYWSAMEQLIQHKPEATFGSCSIKGIELLAALNTSPTIARALDGQFSQPCAEITEAEHQRIDVALEDLTEALQDLAPTGFYFGASEGDGACFGFWLSEDWADALEERGIDCEDPAGTAELIQAFDDHGIEAEQLCDAYCGTADGYSEAQAGAAYAQDLADGNGLLDREPAWPYTCIDWADAWRELEIGDGYSLIRETPSSWHVVRSV
jgi:hypothetical protein